jgi:hypothetical protein
MNEKKFLEKILCTNPGVIEEVADRARCIDGVEEDATKLGRRNW